MARTPARRGSLTARQYLGASRVRGSASWNPRTRTVKLLERALEVLDSYSFPITLRQVFYRLVGLGHLAKREQDYDRLQEHLNRARRAGREGFGWGRIADDTLITYGPTVHAGAYGFVERMVERLKDGVRDFLSGWVDTQPVRVLLWCESQGMASSLRTALRRLGWPVPVLSTSGTDAVRPKRDTAIRAVNHFRATGKRTVIGHISDLDENGLGLADAFAEDVTVFADEYEPGCVTVERIALTPEQVRRFGLPTNPGKPAKLDKTGRLWVPPGGTLAESVQAEAMAPDDLVREVRTWLRGHVDLRALHRSRTDHFEQRQRVLDGFEELVEQWKAEDEIHENEIADEDDDADDDDE